MREATSATSSACAPAWRLVARALDNERALDLRYRDLHPESTSDGLPNYKVMKQTALRAQLGALYPPFVAIAPWVVVLAAPIQWLALMLRAAVLTRSVDAGSILALATTSQNRALITDALGTEAGGEDFPRGAHLASALGARRAAIAVASHLRLLGHLVRRAGKERRDLLLHARDALEVIAITLLARDKGLRVATDDHYQRWAYVLSHAARECRIVQHGFVDEGLTMPHQGGPVAVLYLRDELFLPAFRSHYEIQRCRRFAPCTSFAEVPPGHEGILLASSFPSIDDEIRLVDAIRASSDVPILVKFHPAHRYDARREVLAARVTAVYDGKGNPRCRVFVSHGSFMEFDYRSRGIPSVSIARAGGVDPACRELLQILARCQDDTPSEAAKTAHTP